MWGTRTGTYLQRYDCVQIRRPTDKRELCVKMSQDDVYYQVHWKNLPQCEGQIKGGKQCQNLAKFGRFCLDCWEYYKK